MWVRRVLLAILAVGALGGASLFVVGVHAQAPLTAASTAPAPGMSAVSASTFARGDAGASVPAFEIDPLEVSVSDYDRCVRAGACVLYASAADPRTRPGERYAESARCRGGRPDRAGEPINCVDWQNADAYCRFAGKRLPTREEWWQAVGSRHPAAGPALHRSAKEQPWYAAEWTASAAATSKRGPWPSLRFIETWRVEPSNPEQDWKAAEDWYPTGVRSPSLSFRCAR
jgi:hypothetical protein